MKEKIKGILDKVAFFGHPPPKPINWEETREEILKAFEEQEHRIERARTEVAREIFEEMEGYSVTEQMAFRDGGHILRTVPETSYQSLKDRFLKEVI